jgi:hypothetical protein
MGRGTVNRGINSISIKFKKNTTETINIIEKLENKLGNGYKFAISNSYLAFEHSIENLRIHIPTEGKSTDISIVFTLKKRRSWEDALVDPSECILVQSTSQIDLENQRKTDENIKNNNAIEKGIQQARNDKDKGILRNIDGTIILNLSELRRGHGYADNLNYSFESYIKNGLVEIDLIKAIDAYHRLLVSQLQDTQDMYDWLMDESSGFVGTVVGLGILAPIKFDLKTKQFSSRILRPTHLGMILAVADVTMRSAYQEYTHSRTLTNLSKENQQPELILLILSQLELTITSASGILSKFFQDSIEEAHRLAFGLQILQMALPFGGAATYLEFVCLAAAHNFSSAITNKIKNGSDDSWSKTLVFAGIDSGLQEAFQFGASRLLQKINFSSGYSKEAISSALSTVSNEISTTVVDSFHGATFGEALSNLHQRLKNPDTWILKLVGHTATKVYGKHFELAKSNNNTAEASRNKNIEKSSYLFEKSTRNSSLIKFLITATLVVSFKPSQTNDAVNNKPTISEINRGTTPEALGNTRNPRTISNPTTADTINNKPTIGETNGGMTSELPSNMRNRVTAATSEMASQNKIRGTGSSRSVDNRIKSPSKPSSPTSPPTNPSSIPILSSAIPLKKKDEFDTLWDTLDFDKIDDVNLKKEEKAKAENLQEEYKQKKINKKDARNKLQGIINRVNEKYAEEQCEHLLNHNLNFFGIKKIISKVSIPRRGEKGPSILDLVFKCQSIDGTIKSIVFEVKYNTSKLGWVQNPNGGKPIRQFSPEWFKMRIEEIRKQDTTIAEALETQQVDAYVMRIAKDGSPTPTDYTSALDAAHKGFLRKEILKKK